MISCASFGLPIHAQPLRLFVREQDITEVTHTHKTRQHTNVGEQRCTSCKQQTPNQAAVRASHQDTVLCLCRADRTMRIGVISRTPDD